MKRQHKNISGAIATATCALLTNQTALSQVATLDKWTFKTAALVYSEPDRVQVFEPIIQATRNFDTDHSLSLKLTVDVLTGATPTGAVPTDVAQTITRPSGTGGFQFAANELPLDDTFKDTRVAINSTWNKPLARNWRLNLSGGVSTEYDFQSLTLGGTISRDLNQKNTTLVAGVAVETDAIDPVGGVPQAFQPIQPPGVAGFRVPGDESKDIIDVLLGVTQTINRNTLVQLNYSLSQSDGYLTDPYKVLSVIDPSGRPVVQDMSSGLLRAVYEQRPDERQKQNIYTRLKTFWKGDVFDVSYRYMWDDWDINSHTIDMRYRLNMNKYFWRPHVRLYTQSEADFYAPFLIDGAPITQYASADYRLGDMQTYTVGLEFGRTDGAWSTALEYYLQTGDEPEEKFGELNNQTLFPDFDAVMFRVNVDF